MGSFMFLMLMRHCRTFLELLCELLLLMSVYAVYLPKQFRKMSFYFTVQTKCLWTSLHRLSAFSAVFVEPEYKCINFH